MYEINGVFPSIAEAPAQMGFPGAGGGFGPPAGPPAPSASPDGVRPNWWNPPASQADTGSSGGGLLGALQQFASAFGQQVQGCMQQVMGMFGGGGSSSSGSGLGSLFGNGANSLFGNGSSSPFGNGSSSPFGNGSSSPFGNGSSSFFGGGQTFGNASLGSVGDPHLSLSGTLDGAAGSTTDVDTTFDNMGSHADLFSSPSFRGGFVVSTQATAPEANGVTYNQSATASFDGGRDTVTMNADGALQVDENGAPVTLAAGSTTTLPGGATVSAGNDSVTIDESNPWGATLATTFQSTGSGVNVTAQGQNVTLGGALIGEALQNGTA